MNNRIDFCTLVQADIMGTLEIPTMKPLPNEK